ncbi:MAG TPA: hypothetical protein VFG69_20780 [Nannocystaceae bacterium]|nr:hypothetical protein [Nannocystaceae bacterium]
MGCAIAAIVCGGLATLVIEDPQLDAVRDEVADDDDDDDDGSSDDGVGDTVTGAIDMIGWIVGRGRLPAFASHPYAAGRRAGLTAGSRSRGVAARIALDGAWQYHGLWRGRLAMELDSTTRIGAAVHLYAWGNPGSADHMVLGSARLHAVVGNWKHALVRTGPALDVMRSWTPTKWVVALGADWGISADVFPIRPLVLSFDAQAGVMGRSVYLGARGTIGVTLRRVEIFGGYEHKQIGRAGIGGPVVGMRVWF